PMVGAGDDRAQLAEHLAAVAHADGETVAAGEERLEHRAQLGPLEDAGGPATPGAEDVAVAETAAGGEPGEVVQPLPARDQVAHVLVEGAEAGAFERRGHF